MKRVLLFPNSPYLQDKWRHRLLTVIFYGRRRLTVEIWADIAKVRSGVSQECRMPLHDAGHDARPVRVT